jgi:spore germination protein YaaH
MSEKMKLAKEYGIGGVALWALGYDGKTILDPLIDYKKTTGD